MSANDEDARIRPTNRLVSTLAASLLGDDALSRMEHESANHIIRTEPAYQDCGIVVREIRRATRGTLSLALSRIAGRPVAPELDGVVHEIGRLRAEQGVPLVAVLHAFRLDFRVLWAAIVEAGQAAGVTDRPDFVDGCIDVWDAVESLTDEVVTAYRDRERELDQRRVDERDRAFAELQSNGADSAVVARCANILGLPDHGDFVVLAGSVNADRRECVGRLSSTLARLNVPTYISGPADDVRGVLDRSTLSDDQLRGMLDVLAPGRFGVSPLRSGLAGLSQALRFAGAVLRTLPAGQAGVVYLDQRWTRTIMRRDGELADAFAGDVLAGVLELADPDRDRLMGTLSAYLGGDGSVSGVARAEYLHRNTVRKRLARIENLIGRSLSDPHDVAEIFLAIDWLLPTLPAQAERSSAD